MSFLLGMLTLPALVLVLGFVWVTAQSLVTAIRERPGRLRREAIYDWADCTDMALRREEQARLGIGLFTLHNGPTCVTWVSTRREGAQEEAPHDTTCTLEASACRATPNAMGYPTSTDRTTDHSRSYRLGRGVRRYLVLPNASGKCHV